MANPSGHPYYSSADDTVFVCACDDPKYNAMKEFLYRLMMNNYVAYHSMNKFVNDKENWLMDGVSSYIAAKMIHSETVKKYLDAFANDPTGFQWYGYGSDAQYGSTYTFFEFLEGKYGASVIDRTLYYLGSSMVSNHRCDGLENCALLRAVYDVNGLNMEKSYKISVDVNTLIKGWIGYIIGHYNIYDLKAEGRTAIIEKYDLSALNTFQKVEVMKAIAKENTGLPLTPGEKAVLSLISQK